MWAVSFFVEYSNLCFTAPISLETKVAKDSWSEVKQLYPFPSE